MNTVKTVGDFVKLVRTMREYQKKYFDSKDAFSLGLAKKYEGLVDKAIKERDEREAAAAKKKQGELPGIAGNKGGAA